MIFNLDSSQIVIDGAQSWYGEVVVVGPGICAESAIFVGMGFEGAVLSESGVGYCLESTSAGAVVFNGGHEGAIIPMMSTGAEYT